MAVERDGRTAGEKPLTGRAPSSVEIEVVDGSPWQVTAQCGPVTYRDGMVAGANGVAAPGWFVSCGVSGKVDGETLSPFLELGGDDSITHGSLAPEQVMIDGAIVPSTAKTYSVTR